MDFLKLDSKPMRLLSAFADIMLLNFCWLVGCLPVVTVGSSTVAMYKTLHKMRSRENTPVIRTFFSTWRQDFFLANGFWLVQLLATVLLTFNIFYFTVSTTFGFVSYIVVPLSLAALVLMAGTYQFIYLQIGLYKTSLLAYVKNALVLFPRSLGRGLLAVCVLAVPAVVCFLFRTQLLRISILWFTFGCSAVFYGVYRILGPALEPLERIYADRLLQ